MIVHILIRFITLLKDKKMKKKLINLIILIFFQSNICAKERPSSEPYISGDTFRKFANFILDEAILSFNPDEVKCGDLVFVSTQPIGNVKKFFLEYHPKINNKYILITHNGDPSCPGEFKHYLNDNKIFAWFTQNMDFAHPKLIPVPIGLENVHIGRGHKNIIKDLCSKKINFENKNYLLYANFALHTNPKVREPIFKLFKSKSFCHLVEKRNNVREYLTDITKSKFVLSPEGNGLDCHRTWEALCLGAIPIVKTSTLDILYEGLPVIIVNNWDQITENFLSDKYKEIQNKQYNLNKLYAKYWFELLKTYQIKCKENN